MDFDPWPVVAGVRAGTQAASQPQLVPGLVLAAVQGQSVEGVGMDVARNMLMEAGRPVLLTFVHSAESQRRQQQQGGGSSLRTSMTETWDGWMSWLGGSDPAPSPAVEPVVTNDGGTQQQQQQQQQWQTVTPAQLQQGSETLEGVDSPSMRAVAAAMPRGVDGADGDGDGLGELERELVREALPGGGGSAVLSPWQVGQLHAALPCSERFSTWRRCYSTAVHGSSLNTFFRKVRAGAAAASRRAGRHRPHATWLVDPPVPPPPPLPASPAPSLPSSSSSSLPSSSSAAPSPYPYVL
eukprot:COSAG01_NODE_3906_length_5559_cov_5.852381_4_plen_296_part_00